MPIPYIPQSITVHLGSPSSYAANVTVPFIDYIKNVASSEIYPTWEEAALRANILAQISFALNRVYTEYYRSRGYDFDITSSTAIDQAFVNGRNIFENISQIVDELFNDYIRRQGFVEPLAAKFCNGTTATCDGLSQWGSESLARQGYGTIDILYNYYGYDIELVRNAPIRAQSPSYPGTPIRRGDRGDDVVVIQASLNRVSQNYPAIPKIYPVDGIFGEQTETAVRKFQQVFNLAEDGVVGKATWYELVRLYVGILRLAELNSEGQRFTGISKVYPEALVEGSSGINVSYLQYMLAVISEFSPNVPPVAVTGTFDATTREAVVAFQQMQGLTPDGIVGPATWEAVYAAFEGAEDTVLSREELFPGGASEPAVAAMAVAGASAGGSGNANGYSQTTRHTQYPGYELSIGMSDHVGVM